jgi:hypothetical protein
MPSAVSDRAFLNPIGHLGNPESLVPTRTRTYAHDAQENKFSRVQYGFHEFPVGGGFVGTQ